MAGRESPESLGPAPPASTAGSARRRRRPARRHAAGAQPSSRRTPATSPPTDCGPTRRGSGATRRSPCWPSRRPTLPRWQAFWASTLPRADLRRRRTDPARSAGRRPAGRPRGRLRRASPTRSRTPRSPAASNCSPQSPPPSYGARIKSLEASTAERSLRTLDLWLTGLHEKGLDAGHRHPAQGVGARAGGRRRRGARPARGRPGPRRHPARAAGRDRRRRARRRRPGHRSRCCIAAGRGRVTGLHFGTYDFTAALGVSPQDQRIDAPIADAAKDLLQLAAAGTGVAVSDGSSNILPIGDGVAPRLAHPRPARRPGPHPRAVAGLGPAPGPAGQPLGRDVGVPADAAARGDRPAGQRRGRTSARSRPPARCWKRWYAGLPASALS